MSTYPDILCFSHLRWDFVFQRPQHLLTRFATNRRVFFIEEPVHGESAPRLEITAHSSGVLRVVPVLSAGTTPEEQNFHLTALVEELIRSHGIQDYISWYYTPMARSFTRQLEPATIIYDCMDELSAFFGAPPLMIEMENELLSVADLVFTGGQSLFEAKKDRHPSAYCFPSSIDREHFGRARQIHSEPADQAGIPRPRLGYFGVIDERMDLELLQEMADLRPEWHFVFLGPVVKIDPESLPQRPNLHYLGMKAYSELPEYLAGWDIALLPFAQNNSTRFISPTKTPEYLAGGKPVISTPITDVVRPYGEKNLVYIANTAAGFIEAAESLLDMNEPDRLSWLQRVDEQLAHSSWDQTWAEMHALITAVSPRSNSTIYVQSSLAASTYD